jgi:hypothetical protein
MEALVDKAINTSVQSQMIIIWLRKKTQSVQYQWSLTHNKKTLKNEAVYQTLAL